jgi:hypothetical protein
MNINLKPRKVKIDCDAYPLVPDGWKVKEQKKGGIVTVERRDGALYIDGKEVELYVSDRQRALSWSITGYSVWDDLKEEDVKNACLLDFLLAHPKFIPESWKRDENGYPIHIFFWGTIYRTPAGPAVRSLHWKDEVLVASSGVFLTFGAWTSTWKRIPDEWDMYSPAAICRR